MAGVYTNLYKTYLDAMDSNSVNTPGTHAYEWENYIKPNAPSTDMYHQMATYNMLDKKLPENKFLRVLGGIAAIPFGGAASIPYDLGTAALDYGTDVNKGNTKGSFASYIAGQNPFPQAWNRMRGAGEFVRNELGLGRRDKFNQAYNRSVETPRNLERTRSRVSPSGKVKAYGLRRGGIASL
jgi:hypothetical protein